MSVFGRGQRSAILGFGGGLAAAAALAAAVGAGDQPARERDVPSGRMDEKRAEAMLAMMPADQADGMRRWFDAARPGEHHATLERFLGEWRGTQTIWWDPAAPPIRQECAITYAWKVEGTFIEGEFRGSVMGMPFVGYSLMGYDNLRRQFTTTWIDTMTTAISTSAGSISKDGNTLSSVMTVDEPMTGEMGKSFLVTTTFEGEDEMVQTMTEILYGEPFKAMEMRFTRIR